MTNSCVLNSAIDVGRPVPIRQAVELGIGFLHRSFQRVFRERWKPQTDLLHPLGAYSDRRIPAVLRHRNSVQPGFQRHVCRSRDVDVAVPAADAAMARQVKQYLDTLGSRRTSTLSATVRECIYLMLPSGRCSADHVAQRLGVDRRTLHRQLAREGQTFSSIIDSVRAELVTRYVGNRNHSLASVADLLGFSARSALSRWFRSQFGCSISEWRAQLPSSKSKSFKAGSRVIVSP